MMDNVANLILEHLRAIRADIAEMKATLKEHNTRFVRLETDGARAVRGHAGLYSDRVEDRHTVGSLLARVERIEQRLELV